MNFAEYKNKKVLVTGDNGFIGKSLVEALQLHGSQVLELSKLKIDIKDWNKIRDIQGTEIVFHLAAKTFIPESIEFPKETYSTNVIGTLNMLEYCRLHGSKFIFASTYLYGSPDYLPVNESHPTRSSNPYSGSKLLGENLCHFYSKDYGVNTTILRLFNIYGPNQNDNFLVPTIISQIKNGKIVLNDPRPKRDFVYIDDVVTAFLRAGIYRKKSDIFNISSGYSISVRRIVETIVSLIDKEILIEYLDKRRKNEVLDVVGDFSKARQKLGWSPTIDFKEGILKILDLNHE